MNYLLYSEHVPIDPYKRHPIEITTIICVHILFPLLTFTSLIPASFPVCIYPRVLLLLTGRDFRLFDSEVYYRALSANLPMARLGRK